MTLNVYFINVGQGNMIILNFPDGKLLVYDCNITDDNSEDVFKILSEIMPKNEIDIFVNSHRDADHMRGIKKLHEQYPIQHIWDSGVSENTETNEYEDYMDLRRTVGFSEISPNQVWRHNNSVKILNGKRKDLDDINAQSVVLHIDYNGTSLLLTGDTNAPAWKEYIIPSYGDSVKANILLASHHGSRTFIDHDSYESLYTIHLQKIKPEFTIISVGDNSHGHPDEQALKYYKKYTTGSNQGNKVFTTKNNGNMHLELKGNGNWSLHQNQ